jgi:fucose 4-O-acetylase-like acetyltransferase
MDGKERLVWIDIARGIGVILVVFGHILDGQLRAGLLPPGALARWTAYALYTFHMPLFFFLAGLNVSHSLERGRDAFLQSKLWTIAYPYFLWSLIQGGVIMSLGRAVNTPVTLEDLAAIPYRPMAQFWFLYSLMICHLVAAATDAGKRKFVLASLAALSLVAFYLTPTHTRMVLTLYNFPLYVVGIFVNRAVAAFEPTYWRGAILIWLGFAAIVAFAGNESNFDEQAITAIPACVLGIFGVIWVSKLMARRGGEWLAKVGVMSMTIYILHLLAGAGVRFILLRLHFPPMPALYLLIGTAVGVLAPMLAHMLFTRVGLLPWLGLAPMPARLRAALKSASDIRAPISKGTGLS